MVNSSNQAQVLCRPRHAGVSQPYYSILCVNRRCTHLTVPIASTTTAVLESKWRSRRACGGPRDKQQARSPRRWRPIPSYLPPQASNQRTFYIDNGRTFILTNHFTLIGRRAFFCFRIFLPILLWDIKITYMAFATPLLARVDFQFCRPTKQEPNYLILFFLHTSSTIIRTFQLLESVDKICHKCRPFFPLWFFLPSIFIAHTWGSAIPLLVDFSWSVCCGISGVLVRLTICKRSTNNNNNNTW